MSRFRKFVTIFVLLLFVIVVSFEFYRTVAFAVKSISNQLYSGYLWLGVGFLIYLICHRFFF